MTSTDPTLFQYCQKLVLFDASMTRILLALRNGEADYDGVWSLVGGKLEHGDDAMIGGMRREIFEELGKDIRITYYPQVALPVEYTKASGVRMILPHYLGVFHGGHIELSAEYSQYVWTHIATLSTVVPIIPSVQSVVSTMQKLAPAIMKTSGTQLHA